MKGISAIINSYKILLKKKPRIDQKQQQLVSLGREQFKKLLEKGLSVPVVLL